MEQLTHKGQLEGWEKIFANYSPDKRLVSKHTGAQSLKSKFLLMIWTNTSQKKKDKWPRDAWKMFDVISDSENSVQSEDIILPQLEWLRLKQ